MLDTTYVRIVQEKAELRAREHRAYNYSCSVAREIDRAELHETTGWAIILLALTALLMVAIFGG